MEGTGQTTATQRRQEGELLQAIARGRGSGRHYLRRAWNEESSWQQWQIATAVQNLPLEQQRIIHLAYVLQFTQSEIAKALNIPLGTAKTRLYQGLRTLRPMLAEIGITGVADA